MRRPIRNRQVPANAPPVGAEQVQDGPRRRGPTIGRGLEGIQGHITVAANDEGQPTGKEGHALSQHIGKIMRTGDPIRLDILDWRDVNKDHIEIVMDMIETDFKYENPLTKSWVRSKLNILWKSAKCRLKEKWHDHKRPLGEQYLHKPPNLDPTQWKNLVNYWRSDEGMDKRETNCNNRKKLRIHHRCGRKSFARAEADETRKNGGVKPDKMTMFVVTHTSTQDDQPIASPVQELVEEMQEQVNQAPEDMQVYDARNLAFKEVVGGVVHCSEPMRGLVPPRAIIQQFQDAATREALAKAELAQKAAEETAKKAIEEARDAQERLRIPLSDVLTSKSTPIDEFSTIETHSKFKLVSTIAMYYCHF
ncbi:hypothetical protein L1049_019095 [Liquidambar formosana]|uniref:Transposase n=1 Tax=Liquidambar formosana TaxID=63359 RepID=A0AAP0RB04_LIQFO